MSKNTTFQKHFSTKPKKINLKWGYIFLLLLVLVRIIVLAVGNIPKTNLPREIETWFLENAGWKWAYENNLLFKNPIVKKQDKVITRSGQMLS
ncbi:MAG: hypothetical protein GX922_08085 [Firmicutes bacterium]|nr:hypothetical protein [Bacillota bacterium]